MSEVKESELLEASQTEEGISEDIVEENAGLNKALDTYRKLIDRKDLVEPLTEKEQKLLQRFSVFPGGKPRRSSNQESIPRRSRMAPRAACGVAELA